jgi:hypothetical protein
VAGQFEISVVGQLESFCLLGDSALACGAGCRKSEKPEILTELDSPSLWTGLHPVRLPFFAFIPSLEDLFGSDNQRLPTQNFTSPAVTWIKSPFSVFTGVNVTDSGVAGGAMPPSATTKRPIEQSPRIVTPIIQRDIAELLFGRRT